MIFVKLNGKKKDSLLAREYNIKGYPTFVLTDKHGEEIDRIIGYMEADEFLATIDDYNNGIGTLADLLSRSEGSDDRVLFIEIANKYKYRGEPKTASDWFVKVIEAGEPTDPLSGEATFSLADIKLRDKDYEGAIEGFKKLKEDFKGTQFEELAGIYIPYSYTQLNDTAKAIEGFEMFIKEFPDAEDVEYATNKIKELKGESQ